MVTKCKYHNVGYCKYKDNCKFSHPTSECEKKCQLKNCMKRHIKLCRYGMKCRLKEKCAFKHKESKGANVGNNESAEKMSALENVIKELLDYKIKSEKKIANLESQLDAINGKMAEKQIIEKKQNDIANIKKDLKGLKGEFALLKLCQKNQIPNKIDAKEPEKQLVYTCDLCDVLFKTENGVDVHKEIAHVNTEAVEKKCKYCNYKTVVSAMEEHVVNIHKFRCLKCNYSPVVHSQDRLDYHMRLAHGENKGSSIK
jgi:hypothetical protein